jgi:hypothetical protein
VHISLKVLIKEKEWCKLEISTMIMAVQSLKFLEFIIFANKKKQIFHLKKVVNWWLKPTGKHKELNVCD